MARRIVVLVNGYARAGKDTFCAFAVNRLSYRGWRGHQISSVDPVRNMLRDMGVPVDLKRPAERDLMAEVKSALDRYHGWSTSMCVRQVQDWLTAIIEAPSLCFVHIREPEAIENFKRLLDRGVECKTLLIRSCREERVLSNAADAGVEGMTYDLTIQNDGALDDLRTEAHRLVDFLTEETTSDDDFSQDHPAVA